ncbi:small multidrug resistance pump [Chryseobacterium vrystaatense]|uniref:Small multidrug resistance pump n=2 Tax=Chryseobacterium vrystaatense TaxID=307480 RepID=A0A1M5GE34_9FLAO|nr:small multidrug resistance pump [Chryseobacterium vrystaatense]
MQCRFCQPFSGEKKQLLRTFVQNNLMGRSYIFLALAIIFEIIATTFLKKSEEFSKLWPSVVTVVGYAAAFYFLSITLRHIPVGITYAIWSGVGIVFITMIGIIAFKQVPDLPAIIGIALIVIGVIVINVFSKMGTH